VEELAIRTQDPSTCYIGLDLGGTQIKAGLLDASCRVITDLVEPTPLDSRPEVVVRALHDLARRLVEHGGRAWGDVASIGIGVPGLVESRTGIIRACVNLKGWRDVELRGLMTRQMDKPVIVDNDANAAAFGEYSVALQRNTGLQHLALVTLGTGVGSGIVLNRRVFHGGGGLAGEVGHMIVEPGGHLCGCGQRGCLEQYASATAMVRQATEFMNAGKASTLRPRMDDGTLCTEHIFAAAEQQDQLACRLVAELADYLAIACINLCRIIDLQAVVIGGGVAGAGETLMRLLRAAFSEQDWGLAGGVMPTFSATQLGNDAGFVGAAALAMVDTGDGVLR